MLVGKQERTDLNNLILTIINSLSQVSCLKQDEHIFMAEEPLAGNESIVTMNSPWLCDWIFNRVHNTTQHNTTTSS